MLSQLAIGVSSDPMDVKNWNARVDYLEVENYSNKIGMVFCYQHCSDLMREKCYSDREKLLKFLVFSFEFANFLRSLEQFIKAVKGQNNFW